LVKLTQKTIKKDQTVDIFDTAKRLWEDSFERKKNKLNQIELHNRFLDDVSSPHRKKTKELNAEQINESIRKLADKLHAEHEKKVE